MAIVNGFIKSQRIQWLGHTKRYIEDATIRLVQDWWPEGKRPQDSL